MQSHAWSSGPRATNSYNVEIGFEPTYKQLSSLSLPIETLNTLRSTNAPSADKTLILPKVRLPTYSYTSVQSCAPSLVLRGFAD